MRILLDFDGTLLDSKERHTLVLQRCLSDCGYSGTVTDDYMSCKCDGNSTMSYLKNKLMIDSDDAGAIASSWIELIESAEYMGSDKLYDDCVPFLDFCLKRGHVLYLVSARRRSDYFMKQVASFGLTGYFSGIKCVSPENVTPEKAMYIEEINACTYIGDTEADAGAANKTGIVFYALNRGFRSKSFWERLSVRSFDDLTEVERLLDE